MRITTKAKLKETLDHLICIYEFTQNGYNEGVYLLAKTFGFKERGFDKNVKACISLGYLVNEGGKPRVLRWANPDVKVTKELAQEVTVERIRINKTNDYELVAEKRISLIDVLRAYPLEEIREAYLQYMRGLHKQVPSKARFGPG